ncbi:MAG: hypothetical protein ACXU8N_11520 [Telluria sp.]
MTKRWWGLALLLAAQACHAATEQQWIDAAQAAVAFGQQQGLPIKLLVESGDGLPGHTPVGIRNADGACTLVVSARDNPTAERVAAEIDPQLLDLFLEGAAVHEVGHCYRRLHGFPYGERLLPVVSWIGPVQTWFNRRVCTEEAFADLTTVAWAARFHRERYDALVAAIERVRTRFREPKHDTLPWLYAARIDGPADDGGDLFALVTARLARRQ